MPQVTQQGETYVVAIPTSAGVAIIHSPEHWEELKGFGRDLAIQNRYRAKGKYKPVIPVVYPHDHTLES